jgi:hypothetical protein
MMNSLILLDELAKFFTGMVSISFVVAVAWPLSCLMWNIVVSVTLVIVSTTQEFHPV